jgi:type IV pilus assembly protein PilA
MDSPPPPRSSIESLQAGRAFAALAVLLFHVELTLALPQYLGARNAASLGAAVGEQLGIAKECATFVVSGGVGSAPTGCTATSGGTFSKAATGTANGVTCLDQKSAAKSTVSVGVSATGVITCTFS